MNLGQQGDEPSHQSSGMAVDTSGASLTAELNSLVGIFNGRTDAEPWPMRYFTPNATNPQQPSSFPDQQSGYAAAHAFNTWRSVGLPSDPGTNGVDSGYGDNWPGFFDDTSSYHQAEYSPDTQEAGDLLRDLEVASQSTRTELTQGDGQDALYCTDCAMSVKTRSELNKHIQRHRKPHRCDYEVCPRSKEGFSTFNDLTRHKRSVHKEHDKHGPVYFCPHGTCPTKADKIWPRADNFRSHLSRLHDITVTADDDLTQYTKHFRKPAARKTGQSPRQIRTRNTKSRKSAGRITSASDSASTGAVLSDMKLDPVEEGDDQATGVATGHPVDMSPSTYIPSHHVGASEMTFNPVLQSPQTSENDYVHVDIASSFQVGDSQATNSNLDVDHSQHHMLPASFNTMPSLSYNSLDGMTGMYGMEPPVSALNLHHQAPSGLNMNFSELSRQNMDKSQIIELLKTFPKEMLQEALQNDEQPKDEDCAAEVAADLTAENVTAENSTTQREFNQCSECGKAFNRPCELKKHLKRHEKPYMCTVKSCDKRFGSKNDWKRHEANQHKDTGAWQCTVPGCHTIYMDSKVFQCHLESTHYFEPGEQLTTFIDGCSIDKADNRRFWCGFCQTLVTTEDAEKGKQRLSPWNARCDHIDGHLSGKDGLEQRVFSEWQFLEDGATVVNVKCEDAEHNGGDSVQSRKRKSLEYTDCRPVKRLEEPLHS